MRRTTMRITALAATALGAAALPAESVADAVRDTPVLPEAYCFTPAGQDEPAAEAPPPVLLEGLGFAGIEADSANADARAWFAQGVRLVWAFDEAEAVRAFQMAQRADPECALCHWGEAWARGPTINLQPRTEELEPARAAARRAEALAARKTLSERDRALIAGLVLRTADGPAFANAAYASRMEALATRLPDDDTVAVMAADARMVTWGEERIRPGTQAQRSLERVLARNPGHSGAIHSTSI